MAGVAHLMFGFAVVLILVGLISGGVAVLRRRQISVIHVLVELGGILLLVWTTWLAIGSRNKERLRRLNAEAAADTTVHFLRGQLQVATRLIVQEKPRQAVTTITIRVPGDTVRKVDTVFAGDTVRAELDTNGIHVRAEVALLPPPPTWQWWVARDPITYRAAVACQKGGAARLTISGPQWQLLQLDSLLQDPDVCNPAPSWNPISLKPPSLVWTGALVLGTYLLVR